MVKLWVSILVAELKLPFYYDDDGPEAILIKNGDSFFDRHQTFYPRLVNKNQSTGILFVCYTTTYSDRKGRKIVVFELSNYLLTISNDYWPEKNVWEKKIKTEKAFIPIFFLTFPACFSIPIIFSNLNSNCSNHSVTKNCSDLSLFEWIVLVIEKNFWNSRLKAENLQND